MDHKRAPTYMEALGGYADTHSRETLRPPEQHATNFPHSDFLLSLTLLAGQMVLPGISYALETHFFHPAQTGFPSHLGTRDSHLMLKDTLFRKLLDTSKHPHTLMAVDLRKALYSARQKAIIEAARTRQLGFRALNFIKAFLAERKFTISMPADDPDR